LRKERIWRKRRIHPLPPPAGDKEKCNGFL